jgi:hypothetical protein
VLWADNHKLPGAEISLDAWRAAAVRTAPLPLQRLEPLSSVAPSSVE